MVRLAQQGMGRVWRIRGNFKPGLRVFGAVLGRQCAALGVSNGWMPVDVVASVL